MSNTYTWLISDLECAPESHNKQNVVTSVHWRLRGQAGNLMAEVYGSVAIPYIDTNIFTPFNGLTQAMVISWVEGALGADRLEQMRAALDNQLLALQNPPVVNLPPPWIDG